jgi:hypothetical protein
MEENKKNREVRIEKVNKLPDLHKQEVSKLELCPEYWTPKEEGEYKVGVIINIIDETYVDEKTEQSVILPCIIMLAQTKEGNLNAIKNGSKKLVSSIEDLILSGVIEYDETPIRITYTGKKKNKTNAFTSDNWSVKKLKISS